MTLADLLHARWEILWPTCAVDEAVVEHVAIPRHLIQVVLKVHLAVHLALGHSRRHLHLLILAQGDSATYRLLWGEAHHLVWVGASTTLNG